MSTEPSLSALIVDDEPLARALVREFLRAHPDIQVVGECGNGFDAARDITALNPDLVFLDVQMPKLNGLEVLELTGRNAGVIFTTAYDEYALKAFDHHAVDYLLKPFSQARFDEALAKARQLLGQAAPGVPALLADPGQRLQRILIRDRQQIHVLAVDQIEYIQAQDDYISLYSAGRDYLKTQSLTEVAERLDPQQFVRVHRSYLLNLHILKSLDRASKDSFVAQTQGGRQIPISRAGHERLMALIDRA